MEGKAAAVGKGRPLEKVEPSRYFPRFLAAMVAIAVLSVVYGFAMLHMPLEVLSIVLVFLMGLAIGAAMRLCLRGGQRKALPSSAYWTTSTTLPGQDDPNKRLVALSCLLLFALWFYIHFVAYVTAVESTANYAVFTWALFWHNFVDPGSVFTFATQTIIPNGVSSLHSLTRPDVAVNMRGALLIVAWTVEHLFMLIFPWSYASLIDDHTSGTDND
jgi:hypothetical protein